MKIYSLLLFLLFFCACLSETPKQKGPILFGELYVRYLQETTEVKATAAFLLGDSLRSSTVFKPSGGVQFQGMSMGSRSINPKLFRYNFENKMTFPAALTFSFKGPDETMQGVKGELAPITDFTIPEQLSLAKGALVDLQSAPLNEQETLVMILTNADHQTKSITLNGPSATSQVSIPPAKLKGLVPGSWQLYLVKKQTHFIDQDQQQLSFIIEYYSKSKEIEVIQ